MKFHCICAKKINQFCPGHRKAIRGAGFAAPRGWPARQSRLYACYAWAERQRHIYNRSLGSVGFLPGAQSEAGADSPKKLYHIFWQHPDFYGDLFRTLPRKVMLFHLCPFWLCKISISIFRQNTAQQKLNFQNYLTQKTTYSSEHQ